MDKTTTTWYDKLGGSEAIGKVVDDFYNRVMQDERINKFFTGTDMQAQRRHQTAFLSYALGGPQYTGRSMELAHKGMNLQESDWDAVVEDLAASLKHAGLSDSDIGEIAAKLEPLKPHILHQ